MLFLNPAYLAAFLVWAQNFSTVQRTVDCNTIPYSSKAENITSYTCLDKSGLKVIFHLHVQEKVFFRSLSS